MARFYAEIQGDGGATSRMGNAGSGIWGHIRGWHVGAEVFLSADGWAESDGDACTIRVTTGSTGTGASLLGTLRRGANETLAFIPSVELRDAILKAEGKRAVKDRPSTAVLYR